MAILDFKKFVFWNFFVCSKAHAAERLCPQYILGMHYNFHLHSFESACYPSDSCIVSWRKPAAWNQIEEYLFLLCIPTVSLSATFISYGLTNFHTEIIRMISYIHSKNDFFPGIRQTNKHYYDLTTEEQI